ncbi:hypothetical protein PG984_013190 [Apiospora sp. TS-2023a]
MPTESTPELKARAAAYVGTFAHALGAIGIPCLGDANTLPVGTRSALLTLDKEETERAMAACKQVGISMSAAVHASVAGANYALADEADRDKKHYSSTVRFGLRPHLLTPAAAAGLYTTGWMARVEPQMSWAERAQSYTDEYKKDITRDFIDAHREYAAQLGAMLRTLKPGSGPSPSDVDISNMGNVDKMVPTFYGTPEAGFEVTAVGGGVEILSRQGIVYVWTFRGQLNLGVNYKAAFHSDKQITKFVRTVRLQLLEGLFPGGKHDTAD